MGKGGKPPLICDLSPYWMASPFVTEDRRNALRGAGERSKSCVPFNPPRSHGEKELRSIVSAWPVDRPRRWAAWVDEPESSAETEAIRACVRRSSPLGTAHWTRETAEQLNLEWTLRPRGRPAKRTAGSLGAIKELRPL
jgi:hypothetical protein